MWCARVVNNKQVIEDPNVSVFNAHRFFFLNVLTRACAEYVNFVATTPGAPSLTDPSGFIAHAEHNIDFAWVCHFLYDAGFLVLDFLQSVRANESEKLDLLWREFFCSAHSGTANKTQYVPMAIMRVFWGMALAPELSALYHKIRTIPTNSGESCTGWDMAIEQLNLAIKSHVCHRISEVQIDKFIETWALLEHVQERMRTYLYSGRSHSTLGHSVDSKKDVDALVAKFKAVIGTTWAEATRNNTNSHVTEGAQRARKPWHEVADVMARTGADSPAQYVRTHVRNLTPFFEWAA